MMGVCDLIAFEEEVSRMIDYPAFRVLYWLSTVTPEDQHPPAAVCPLEDQRDVYDELAYAGLIEEAATLDGSFGFILSGKGKTEARRLRREYRPELARRCVLSFLADADALAQRRGLEDSDWADDYTGRLTAREIDEAADDLAHLQLIDGTRRAGGWFYVFKITPAGRRALRGPAPIGDTASTAANTHLHTSTTTNVTGDNNQIAAGIDGQVSQTMSVDNSYTVAAGYENVDQIVRNLLDQLPLLPLNESDQDDLRDDAQVVLGEILADEPDRKAIRRALNGLRGLLSPLLTGINQAVTAESAEIARHTIDHITASGLA
jgi:hypothetical protein